VNKLKFKLLKKNLFSFFIYKGVEGFTSSEDQEQLQRIEKQIRRRFVVGSQVSENSIIQDLVKQVSKKCSLLQNQIFILRLIKEIQ
jgi:hypothetical protein